VDESNKNPKTVVVKFYVGLKNYKTKKPLEDLAVRGLTIKEFWQQRLYRICVWKVACSKTCPSKVSVDHTEIPRVVLSCICL
jgi:hypothetical protein